MEVSHPFNSRLVVETICGFLPMEKPPCLVAAVENICHFRGGRRVDVWSSPGSSQTVQMRCDLGVTWSRNPRALAPGERRLVLPDWSPIIAPRPSDMPLFLDAVRVLMDTSVARPVTGTAGLPPDTDGYEVEWLLYERGTRDMPSTYRTRLPLEVLRYMPPTAGGPAGPGCSQGPGGPGGPGPRAAYVEVAFSHDAEFRLIRRYDSGWMDIWRYKQPELDQDPIHYHPLHGSTHWRTTMTLLWQWAQTINKWPRLYSKFTVDYPGRGSVRVNVWVSLSAPTCLPVRQTCWSFCRQHRRQPA